MAISTNNFIDLGLRINENDTTSKNILLLGNTKGFFGNKIEGDTIANYSSSEIVSNNYNWLEYEYNECKSNIYVIADDDTIKYYNYLIQEIANWCPGTHKKWKSISIDWYAKKYKISEDKTSIGYVNIIKELSKKKYMKIDKIIMNPPYDGNLHLKILEQAISLLKDNGNCINLSPIRWLQDPLAESKKNSDWYKFKGVRERIESLTPISAKTCTELFGGEQDGAAFSEEIGVYSINKNLSNWEPIGNPILEKILDKVKVSTPEHRIPYSTYANRSTENFIVLKKIHDSVRRGSIRDLVIRSRYGVFINGKCKDKSLFETKESIKNSVHGDVNNFPVICMKTPTEAVNVYNSFKTTFYRYVCSKASVDQNVPLRYLPWMGDCINPRTRLKGYEGEWTDKDFYEYFNINEQEQKEIEETMKPYM